MPMLWRSAILGAGLLAASTGLPAHADEGRGFGGDIKRVLLISIDGMHALDFINCAGGISGVNGGGPYCPNLAGLAETGVNYLDTSTSKPSDSFPGLMALVSGGSPRTVGAFYDVAYDRSLDPPATTTGNGVAGAPGLCTPNTPPTGTTTEFDEGIDIDQTQLNGGAPAGVDGGIASIDPNKLERDPARQCAPVYPWNFVRTNTIFGAVHAAGGYTAWSDKHPSYSSVSGPGNGTNLDDYFSPEINSIPVALPSVPGCNPQGAGDTQRDQWVDARRQETRADAKSVWHELPSGQRRPETHRKESYSDLDRRLSGQRGKADARAAGRDRICRRSHRQDGSRAQGSRFVRIDADHHFREARPEPDRLHSILGDRGPVQ